MRYNNYKLKKQMQKEYSQKGYSFRSEMFLINERLVKELISKAFATEFIKTTEFIDEYDYTAIRLINTGQKVIPYKFRKSVNYSSRKEKTGQPDEIKDCLFILKERYKYVERITDIIRCNTHIELTIPSEKDKDLYIVFKVHHENTYPEFSYDLSIRYYREFFEQTDTIET
jgi:hypothetical protein